jgi:hypothetical protein
MGYCDLTQKLCMMGAMAEQAERPMVTAAEAARILGISHRAVLDRLKRGLMRGDQVSPKIWLVPRDELERIGTGRLKTGPKPRSVQPD